MTLIHLIRIILCLNLLQIINASIVNPFKDKGLKSVKSKNQKNYNVPIIIFGGMGAKCRNTEYKNLIKQLKQNFNPKNIKCYENNIFGSMLE